MKRLLATDMDGTVIPLRAVKRYRSAIAAFSRLAARDDLVLAYITGRHLELAQAGIAEHGLPLPRVLVGDVGTAVYWREGGNWRMDEEYQARLHAAWQGMHGSELGRLLCAVDGLVPQEQERQQRFKRSYYLDRGRDPEEYALRVTALLSGRGIAASVITSYDPVGGVHLLDVLPPAAAKDMALRYLAERLGIPLAEVIYAGDSGNDLAAFASGCRAIVVGNVDDPTLAAVERLRAAKGWGPRLYLARGRYTAGVMEGCRHFGLGR